MRTRTFDDPSDRKQLEEGEARVLFATWQHTGDRVLTAERIEWLERKYGLGSVKRIKHYMMLMKNGELL